MNEAHRDAMDLYATRLLGAESSDWRCIGCDPEGIDIQAGMQTVGLGFPERARNAAELRKMLARRRGARKRMAASGPMSQSVAYEESAVVNVSGIMLLMRNCAERSRALCILKGRRIR
jgi:hypothetical protein